MANPTNPSMVAIFSLFLVAFTLLNLHGTEAEIGVGYGNLGDNLPSPQEVVNLYQSNGIKSMRIYDPDQDILQALQGSGITLVLGVPNDNVQGIASSQDTANQWVNANVAPYNSFITTIVVGNELPTSTDPSSIVQAMQNLLNTNQLNGIKVTTCINYNLLQNTYPPSHAEFQDPTFITPIINFLNNNNSPLFVNIYPLIAYQESPDTVPLEYALFQWPGIKFYDDNGLGYQNLFDAMVDAVYAAMGKIGGSSAMTMDSNGASNSNVGMSAGESGCSSSGGPGANLNDCGTYYRNLANHVGQGTPLKPGQPVQLHLFSMFDEDKKPGDESERHYGIFNPDGTPKYGQINF